MELRRSPAALPAAALVAGAAAGAASLVAPVSLAALLAALGVALGRAPGRALSALALGLLAAWTGSGSPAEGDPRPSGSVPVVLVGRLTDHWTRGAFGWTARLRVERYRQGTRVARWRRTVAISCYGDRAPPAGVSLRLRGYLGRAPGFANLQPGVPGPWRLRVKSARFVQSRPPAAADLPARLSILLRRLVHQRLEGREGSRGPALGRALLFGDRRRLDPHTVRGLRASGLAHLLAVSGLHVGLLATAAWGAGAVLRGPWRHLPPLVLVAGYLLLVGPYPAVVRASAMALLAGFGLACGRPALGLNSLAVVAAAMVWRDPENLRSLGFLLTASATAGILCSGRLFARRWTALPPALRRPLAVSAGAQLFTLPWAATAFHLLHPAAPLLNLLAVPWTALALLVAFAWLAAELAAPSLLGGWATGALDLVAAPFALAGSLPPSPWLGLPVALARGEALLLAAALGACLRRPRPWIAAAAVALALLLVRPPASPPRPELVMLDVGQGEALLLRDRGRAVLVDGGGWRHGDFGGRVLLPALARLGVRRLTAVVLTHPDGDHCGGLVDIAGYLPVGEVWTAPGWHGRRCWRELLTRPGVAWRPVWAGSRAEVGRWRLEVVHPVAGDRRGGNDGSLVVVAEASRLAVLLTGDLEAAGERRLLERRPDIVRGGVLKVGHHGSKTSTSRRLLEAVQPRLALVSAGVGNRYGHPAPEVVHRLRRAGIPLLRTDRDGMIRLTVAPGGSLRLALPAAPR